MFQPAVGRASQRTVMIDSFLQSLFIFVCAALLDRKSAASICCLVDSSLAERCQESVLVETACLPLKLLLAFPII